MPTCSVAGEAKVGDDFGPGVGLWSLCGQERVKDLILLFLFVGLVWFGLVWFGLVCLFVCFFVCLFFCLSVFQIPSLSKFLTSLSSKLFETALKNLGISQDSCILSYFLNMFNPLKRRPFPLNPRVAQHTAACRHCRRGPATCRAGSPEDWKKAEQAGSSHLCLKGRINTHIYIYFFFFHNKYTVYLEKKIYICGMDTYVYIYAFYTFFL